MVLELTLYNIMPSIIKDKIRLSMSLQLYDRKQHLVKKKKKTFSYCSSLAIKSAEDNGPTRRDPATDLLCDGEQ